MPYYSKLGVCASKDFEAKGISEFPELDYPKVLC